MTESTSNHGWEIPEVGGSEDVWGQILNDFFDNELDRQVTLEDTIANRPAAGDTVVKYFHATDEDKLYFNNGTSWIDIAGKGSSGSPISGTSYVESLNVTNGSLNVTGNATFSPDGRVDVDLESAAGENAAMKFVQDGTDKWSFFFRDSTDDFEFYNYTTTDTAFRIDADTNDVEVSDGNLDVFGNAMFSPGGRVDVDLEAALGDDAALKFLQDGTDKWSFFFRDSDGAFEFWNYETMDTSMRIDPDTNDVEFPTGGLTVSGSLSGVPHSDLESIGSSDHHVRFEASEVNSSNWNDYEIQKNGTDGNGIINFKT